MRLHCPSLPSTDAGKNRYLMKRRRWPLVSSEKWGKIKSKSKNQAKPPKNPNPVSKQRTEVVHDAFQSVGGKQAAWATTGEKVAAETLHLDWGPPTDFVPGPAPSSSTRQALSGRLG